MAHISGGEVSYGRTVKTGDYENKRIDVKLTFGVDEGEDVEAILQKASLLALNKAHEILGITVPASVKKVADKEIKTTAAKGKAGAAAITEVEKTQTAAAATAATVTDGDLSIPENLRRDKPQISTGGERVNPAQVPDELDVLTADITDAQLTDAAKAANKRINNPVAIKAVRDKYTGKTPSILSEIPKDKRQAFLDELAKLK